MATSNLFCAICFEYYKSNDDILCSTCGHVFHNSCFKDWLNRSSTCPDCCSTNPQTHPLFLHIDDPSLAKRKLLEQLEESEQNFFSMQSALTISDSKCTELSNELQLQKAQIESYEQELSKLKQNHNEDKNLEDALLKKELEISRLNSLNSMLEKKLTDIKQNLLAIIDDSDPIDTNIEKSKNLNQINLVKIKQLVDDLEIEVLIDKFENKLGKE